MQITAIVPWFGSKRTLAPRIVEALGPHKAYWEPLCGSLAVLLAKEPATMETACDIHGDLINLAWVVQDEALAPELYGRLARVMMCEKLFKAEAAAWKQTGHQSAPATADIDRAYQFFICSWMGMNGVAGTQSYNQGFCARFTKNGGHAGTRFVAAVESIPWWHQRLRTVTILDRDAFKVIDKIEDAPGVVIYVDPPYLTKGAKYVHDFEAADHDRLAKALARFQQTRVVVSYYEHPRLVELYPGWQHVDCTLAKAMVASGKRDTANAPRAPEVLLINERQPGLW